MSNSLTLPSGTDCWVGIWKKRRLVVYDPSIQPSSEKFMLLYFVQGRSLCFREKAVDRPEVVSVKNEYEKSFALNQYFHWLSLNRDTVSTKQMAENVVPEQPSALKVRCPVCEGNSTWHYTVGTFADGAHSDGQNVSGHCYKCGGTGFVEDVFALPSNRTTGR